MSGSQRARKCEEVEERHHGESKQRCKELKRLRGDEKDEYQRNREELERIRERISPHIELNASTKLNTPNLTWYDIKSATFAVNRKTGNVSTQCTGIYSIVAVVKASASLQRRAVTLVKNETIIQCSNVAYNYDQNTKYYWISLSTAICLEANDCLAVRCSFSVQQAFLSIVRLGSC
ncbi:hypothetical protein PsorP6_015883 [Peronosclerospora sorghi]|uniref:Uncharacterized protein n=1 Tax=Peronosclerospora sorghi TaxID=230839 RepID=A0ACC0WPK5_9STRA|nr:hypothetical protein PsorP6_015883 [Peronosclerospora sorghi]